MARLAAAFVVMYGVVLVDGNSRLIEETLVFGLSGNTQRTNTGSGNGAKTPESRAGTEHGFHVQSIQDNLAGIPRDQGCQPGSKSQDSPRCHS
jgi:hypothetical protein